jgi:hypothetical protein
MVDGRVRHVQPLIAAFALVLVAFGAVACGPRGSAVEAAAQLGVEPSAIVEIGDEAVAPIVGTDGHVSVLVIHERAGKWVASPITSSPGRRGTDSLHLISYDGETGDAWNTFVYGTAAPGTVRVRLAGFPDQRGGMVVGGGWIIALREKGLGPDDIEWAFEADDGTVRTGTGIFPPDA